LASSHGLFRFASCLWKAGARRPSPETRNRFMVVFVSGPPESLWIQKARRKQRVSHRSGERFLHRPEGYCCRRSAAAAYGLCSQSLCFEREDSVMALPFAADLRAGVLAGSREQESGGPMFWFPDPAGPEHRKPLSAGASATLVTVSRTGFSVCSKKVSWSPQPSPGARGANQLTRCAGLVSDERRKA
jgi:hypothetical protein